MRCRIKALSSNLELVAAPATQQQWLRVATGSFTRSLRKQTGVHEGCAIRLPKARMWPSGSGTVGRFSAGDLLVSALDDEHQATVGAHTYGVRRSAFGGRRSAGAGRELIARVEAYFPGRGWTVDGYDCGGVFDALDCPVSPGAVAVSGGAPPGDAAPAVAGGEPSPDRPGDQAAPRPR